MRRIWGTGTYAVTVTVTVTVVGCLVSPYLLVLSTLSRAERQYERKVVGPSSTLFVFLKDANLFE